MKRLLNDNIMLRLILIKTHVCDPSSPVACRFERCISPESQRYKQKVRGKGGSDKSSFIKDRRQKKASIEQSLSGR